MKLTKDEQRILYILKYTRKIERRVHEIKTFDVFVSDEDNVDLISFWCQQISEYVSNLSEEFKAEYDHIPWRQIQRFRSIPTHHYERLNREDLWKIVTEHLTELHEFVQQQACIRGE